MADPSEGEVRRSADLIARQTLKQLRTRLGYPAITAPIGSPPEVIDFYVMNIREVWRRSKVVIGEETLYELERP